MASESPVLPWGNPLKNLSMLFNSNISAHVFMTSAIYQFCGLFYMCFWLNYVINFSRNIFYIETLTAIVLSKMILRVQRCIVEMSDLYATCK